VCGSTARRATARGGASPFLKFGRGVRLDETEVALIPGTSCMTVVTTTGRTALPKVVPGALPGEGRE
jgi:hypothetical protein